MVMDSAGIGAMPDAGAYGDEGSDTLGHVLAFWLVLLCRRVAEVGRVSGCGE